jgi:hypothetical protein
LEKDTAKKEAKAEAKADAAKKKKMVRFASLVLLGRIANFFSRVIVLPSTLSHLPRLVENLTLI